MSEKMALQVLREELNIKLEWVKQRDRLGISFPHQLRSNRYREWINRFSDNEAEEVLGQINSMRGGLYSVMPIICTGDNKCPHNHVCPFLEKGKAPIGLQCPLEQTLIMDKMELLMVEHEIDGSRASEFILLNRVVELELSDFRVSSMLSSVEHQGVLKKEIGGSTSVGELYEVEVINPLLEVKERISREKMKILDILVSTPRERYKKQAALKEVVSDRYVNKISALNKKVADIESKMLERGK